MRVGQRQRDKRGGGDKEIQKVSVRDIVILEWVTKLEAKRR